MSIKRTLRLMSVVSLLVFGALLAACTAAGTTESAPASGITNITWQWVSVDSTQSGGEMVTVPNPENYTLILRDDGTLSGMADCNSFTGTYTQESGGFDITLGAMTAMACPDGSLDTRYLELLNSAVAGGPAGEDTFALTGAGGVDYMLFRNGGTASSE